MDLRFIKNIINYENYTRSSRFDGTSYSFVDPALERVVHIGI